MGYNGASTVSTYAVMKLKIFPSLSLEEETKTYAKDREQQERTRDRIIEDFKLENKDTYSGISITGVSIPARFICFVGLDISKGCFKSLTSKL